MLVLSIPGFLEKVVGIACRLPYLTCFPRNHRELNRRIRRPDDSISQEIALESSEHPLDDDGFAHSKAVAKDLTSRTQVRLLFYVAGAGWKIQNSPAGSLRHRFAFGGKASQTSSR